MLIHDTYATEGPDTEDLTMHKSAFEPNLDVNWIEVSVSSQIFLPDELLA